MKRVVMHVMRTLNTDSEYDHCSMVIDDAVGELRHFSPDSSHGWADVDGAVKEKQFRNCDATLSTSSDQWCDTIIPGLIHSDAFLAQQQRHNLGMAFLTRHEKWRDTIIPGLIHIDALLAQQQRHNLGIAFLTRDEKWRDTIICGLIHIDAFLAQQR